MSRPKRCLSARIWPAVNDQSICALAARLRHAEQQEFAHTGREILLHLAQQRVAGLLVHAGQARHRLAAAAQRLGDEQRLDQLIELHVDFAREGANMLVLPQAAQIEGAHRCEDGAAKRRVCHGRSSCAASAGQHVSRPAAAALSL